MYNAIIPDDLLSNAARHGAVLRSPLLYTRPRSVDQAAKAVFNWILKKGFKFPLARTDDLTSRQRQVALAGQNLRRGLPHRRRFELATLGIQYQ